jgi:hypothetical protein
MKSELFHSEKQPEQKNESLQGESLTDWERIKNMKDEDIILDDEHPEADPAHMTNIVVRHNMKIVRIIKSMDGE